jgi:catechol 2,3-dioxygenase-like lactoylglutathione lyase family enzyme
MEWRMELVFVPVADVDRAKAFYRDQVGFHEDFDTRFSEAVRMVQLTPPGSGCSIALLSGMIEGRPDRLPMEPGSLRGLTIVVSDINAARAQLTANGVEVTEVMEAVHQEATSVYRPVTGEPEGWNAYAFFDDPDGNGWVLQQSPPEDPS